MFFPSRWKVWCFGPFQVWSWFSLGASSKEEDLHDFQTYGQEHTRPLVGSDGVGKLPMGSSGDVTGHDLLLLDINYWSTMYIHISSYYTHNCVHEYSLKCLCIFYAKYSIYHDISHRSRICVAFIYSTLKNPLTQHTVATSQETKMLLFLLGLCSSVACVISLAKGGAFMLSSLRLPSGMEGNT